MLESAIVRSIQRTVTRHGWILRKTHGSGKQSGMPDLIGCADGWIVCIEVKRPGGKPTAKQAAVLRRWARAGAITGCATSAAEAVAIIEAGIRAARKKAGVTN